MKKLNKSRYAVLGVLAGKPRSGYEILQFMRQSTAHFWQESDASIYPMLKQLEKEGKITGQQESQGKRERRVFEITQTGLEEVQHWLALPAQQETHRNEFLLKLFFGALINENQITTLLQKQLAKIENEKKTYRHIEKSVVAKFPDSNPHKLFWGLALQYGITQCNCEEQWLKKSLERITDDTQHNIPAS